MSDSPMTEKLYRELHAKVGTGPQRWIDALVAMTNHARQLELERAALIDLRDQMLKTPPSQVNSQETP